MSGSMTHWERIEAALKGEAVDRPPISLWRHWPGEDDTAEGLAAATVRWQKAHDFDLVKFMPTGTYGVEDWGAEVTYAHNPSGTRTITAPGLTTVEEWSRLEALDVTKGFMGQQNEALRLTAEALADSVPILQTVFSPLTTARKLAGDRVFTHMRCHPDALKEGLGIIAETTVRFALAALDAGAHGLFFASQCSSYQLLNEAEYRAFGEPFDRAVLNAVQSKARFNMAHAHGDDAMFDILAAYPVQMMNWHDRRTWPSLAEARERFPGLLVGGIDDRQTLLNGSADAIRAEIQDAIGQGAGRLMVGPQCVMSIDTPDDKVRIAVEAVTGGGAA
ncbi:MAG TPA: uroporphyrinogen decarboxylase family protein [Rhodospirillales bacterium]|nr:uroporphyrinogen decarboxylase family protein [Rhodospirillales bacterium]